MALQSKAFSVITGSRQGSRALVTRGTLTPYSRFRTRIPFISSRGPKNLHWLHPPIKRAEW